MIPGGSRCLAVMYHYVHDSPPESVRGVRGLTASAFEAQLDELLSIAEPIDWPRLYAWRRGRAGIPSRCFLLTFDDGLADHAEIVLPILQRRGIRGVFFVSGSTLTTTRMLPAHAIHLLLASLGTDQLRCELLDHLTAHWPGSGWVESVNSAAAESMYHYEPPALAHLKYLLTVALPIAVRNQAVEELFERHVGSPARWARRWYLTWDHLSEIQSLGHTIGGHGHLHEPLLRLSAEAQLQDMLAVAQVLRDGLGPDLRPFSYPYGSVDAQVAAACARAGFEQGFTTEPHVIDDDCDVFRLPRVDAANINAALIREFACNPM